jgi:hypothetical protein
MANGFYRDGAARGEIDAERRMMRHSSNSFDVSGQMSAALAASFSQH